MQLTLLLLTLLILSLQAARAFRDVGSTRRIQHASTLSVPAARQLATGGKNSTAKGAPRPLWQDIVLSDLNTFFDSSEVLQMYHLAATDTVRLMFPATMACDSCSLSSIASRRLIWRHDVHLICFTQLFEQGGLDHALDFLLTAIAFQSMDRPAAQVRLPLYHELQNTLFSYRSAVRTLSNNMSLHQHVAQR
jgi:hypothetical protein